jgi:hypothetical protein
VDGRNWWWEDRAPAGWLTASGYRAEPSISGGTFDLKAFIDDVRGRHPEITDDWTLQNLSAGFECWSGCVGLGITSFQLAVNQ